MTTSCTGSKESALRIGVTSNGGAGDQDQHCTGTANKPLSRRWRDASRNLRVMDADLKAAATEFKVTGDAQQYYTEKSRSLKEQIAQQEQVVDALVNAVRKSAAVYGNNSAKTDEWRIKLSNATAKLMTMKKGLQDTDKEAEEFGRGQ